MPWNSILPALLGGYWFLHRVHFRRFRSQSLSGYHLLLQAAIRALFFALTARIVVFLIDSSFPDIQDRWFQLWPEKDFPYSGTAVGSFLVAVICAEAANLIHLRLAWRAARKRAMTSIRSAASRFPWIRKRPKTERRLWYRLILLGRSFGLLRDVAMAQAVDQYGNSLERLLFRAAKRGDFVAVTLESRKVYVGQVVDSPNLENQKLFVGLLPVMSGFRTEPDLQFQFTTDYTFLQRGMAAPEGPSRPLEEYTIYFPVDDITTANLFDFEEYLSRFRPVPEEETEERAAGRAAGV